MSAFSEKKAILVRSCVKQLKQAVDSSFDSNFEFSWICLREGFYNYHHMEE